jgi:hypothetical protein
VACREELSRAALPTKLGDTGRPTVRGRDRNALHQFLRKYYGGHHPSITQLFTIQSPKGMAADRGHVHLYEVAQCNLRVKQVPRAGVNRTLS